MSWFDGGYTAQERTAAGIVGANGRGRTKWIVPVVVAACYAIFTLAVHLRMLDFLDLAVRSTARPDDVWGTLQIRAARVVQGLQPAHLVVPLLLVVAIVSLFRRSLRPFVAVGIVGGLSIIVTLGTKWIMSHTDTDATPVAHGHFPSGHTVSVTVAVGVVVLLLRPRTRWGWILPAFVGFLMGCSLVVIAMHPLSDVVGAVLLAVAALATARVAGLGQWAAVRRTGSGEESSDA
jgi:membrane-associated phospholipid phosphatase